jgi:sigma-B regulation protein RsbU (phosphoserine phosphatase)
MKDQTILIVDDEPINRMVLSRSFSTYDYRTIEAETGEEALRFLDTENIDIVLLDIMMPGIDGYEVCKKIKHNPKTHEIPVIFITALNDKKSKIRGLETGAVDFIVKPFDLFEVRLRVKQHLRMRELYMEIKKHNANMKREILNARKIQSNLLPENYIKISDNLEFMFEYYPCEDLGGDFLDIFKLDDEHFCFYNADVSGHGVASSLVTIFVKEFFRRSQYQKIIDVNDPAAILTKLNKSLLSLDFGDRYLTIFLGIINIRTGMINWSCAGANNLPFMVSTDTIKQLEAKSIAVGWFEDATWENYQTLLNKGELIFLYSDAAVEIRNEENEELGYDGLEQILRNLDIYNNTDLDLIVPELLEFGNRVNFVDDLTLMILKREQIDDM